VRHGVIEVDEERPRIAAFDERGRFSGEQVVHVVAVEVSAHLFAVPPQVVGELAMRVPVIEESERVVESLFVRLAGRARLAESPLADDRGAISRVAQHLRHRHVVWPERDVPAGQATVASNPAVSGVHGCHERRTRWGAHGAAGVILREPRAFSCEPIERRRLETRLAVRAEVAVAEVVSLNEQYIRRRAGRLSAGGVPAARQGCDDEQ